MSKKAEIIHLIPKAWIKHWSISYHKSMLSSDDKLRFTARYEYALNGATTSVNQSFDTYIEALAFLGEKIEL